MAWFAVQADSSSYLFGFVSYGISGWADERDHTGDSAECDDDCQGATYRHDTGDSSDDHRSYQQAEVTKSCYGCDSSSRVDFGCPTCQADGARKHNRKSDSDNTHADNGRHRTRNEQSNGETNCRD